MVSCPCAHNVCNLPRNHPLRFICSSFLWRLYTEWLAIVTMSIGCGNLSRQAGIHPTVQSWFHSLDRSTVCSRTHIHAQGNVHVFVMWEETVGNQHTRWTLLPICPRLLSSSSCVPIVNLTVDEWNAFSIAVHRTHKWKKTHQLYALTRRPFV